MLKEGGGEEGRERERRKGEGKRRGRRRRKKKNRKFKSPLWNMTTSASHDEAERTEEMTSPR